MTLDYRWSTAHHSFFLFHLSFVYIYVSENNTRAWSFWPIFSRHLTLSFSFSLLFAYHSENNKGTTGTKYHRTIVCCYFFLRLDYLAGNNRKMGRGKHQRSHYHLCFYVCMHRYSCLHLHACNLLVDFCMYIHLWIGMLLYVCVCVCFCIGINVCVCVCLSIRSDPECLGILKPGSKRTTCPKWKHLKTEMLELKTIGAY